MECGSLSSRRSFCDQQERASGRKRNTSLNQRALYRQNVCQDCVERLADFEFAPELEVATAVSLHSRADHKWQKQRNERGHSLDSEPGLVDFSAQFGSAVAALVHRVFIDGAPQEPVLRHRDKKAAAGSCCPEHLPQRSVIFDDVFKNIECSDHIELTLEGNLARIHLI